MNTMLGQWEDEENNRQVQFSVDYLIENSTIEIKNVTPNKVSFVCPESNTILRSIGVHTAKGQNILRNKIEGAGKVAELKNEIARRNNVLAAV